MKGGQTPANLPATTHPLRSPLHVFTSVRISCLFDFFLWSQETHTPGVCSILLNKALLCDPYQSAFPTFVTVCVCVCVYTCMRIQGKQTHPSTFQLPFHRLTEVALYPARHRQVQCVPPCYFSRFLQNEINHYSITPRSCARAKAHHPEMLS